MAHDPEKALVDKATNDPAFRAALVADPKGTLESTFGVALPDGMVITVVEETPTQRYIVLPSASLSEAELADVSGAGTGLQNMWNE
jgi:hypothetical protein